MHVGSAAQPLAIEASPVLSPARPVYELFGMKFLEVDKDLQEKLFLDKPYGLLVIDPGPRCKQLGVGSLRRGDCIWAVGDEQPIRRFDEFTRRLLALCDQPRDAGQHPFVGGISSWLDRSSVWGEYHQITLSEPEIAELRRKVRPGR